MIKKLLGLAALGTVLAYSPLAVGQEFDYDFRDPAEVVQSLSRSTGGAVKRKVVRKCEHSKEEVLGLVGRLDGYGNDMASYNRWYESAKVKPKGKCSWDKAHEMLQDQLMPDAPQVEEHWTAKIGTEDRPEVRKSNCELKSASADHLAEYMDCTKKEKKGTKFMGLDARDYLERHKPVLRGKPVIEGKADKSVCGLNKTQNEVYEKAGGQPLYVLWNRNLSDADRARLRNSKCINDEAYVMLEEKAAREAIPQPKSCRSNKTPGAVYGIVGRLGYDADHDGFMDWRNTLNVTKLALAREEQVRTNNKQCAWGILYDFAQDQLVRRNARVSPGTHRASDGRKVRVVMKGCEVVHRSAEEVTEALKTLYGRDVVQRDLDDWFDKLEGSDRTLIDSASARNGQICGNGVVYNLLMRDARLKSEAEGAGTPVGRKIVEVDENYVCERTWDEVAGLVGKLNDPTVDGNYAADYGGFHKWRRSLDQDGFEYLNQQTLATCGPDAAHSYLQVVVSQAEDDKPVGSCPYVEKNGADLARMFQSHKGFGHPDIPTWYKGLTQAERVEIDAQKDFGDGCRQGAAYSLMERQSEGEPSFDDKLTALERKTAELRRKIGESKVRIEELRDRNQESGRRLERVAEQVGAQCTETMDDVYRTVSQLDNPQKAGNYEANHRGYLNWLLNHPRRAQIDRNIDMRKKECRPEYILEQMAN